jgi:4-hydroxythreonine-4-phosphate dehydrogenase
MRGRKVIGIALGDPAGIGPEIVLKSLAHFPHAKLVLIGSRAILTRTAQKLKLAFPARTQFLDDGSDFVFAFGRVQKRCGEAALRALETGVCLLKQGVINGLVTAPVSKEALRLAGFEFPGQTEFLAARLGAKRHAMMAYLEGCRNDAERTQKGRRIARALRIVFVTIHMPIAEVPKAIAAKLVAEKIRLLHDFLRSRERIRQPRIAVLALNPHAHEFSLGEEARIVRGIRLVRRTGVAGPFPADTLVQLLPRFDGIVAMYHDQAMIPAKLLAQGRGVNMTIGLPFIRTSPLHGTAFDIAGNGIAQPDSMTAAIETALRLA